MAKNLKKYVGTVSVEAVSEVQAFKRFNDYVKDLLDNGNCAVSILDSGFKVSYPVELRLISVKLYRDEDTAPITLVNEGQNFEALFRAFNKQDQPDTNPDCLGFTDFMKANGVKVVEDVNHECLEYYQ